MPIFDQGYQHWTGHLSGHAWRWLAITRHGVRVGTGQSLDSHRPGDRLCCRPSCWPVSCASGVWSNAIRSGRLHPALIDVSRPAGARRARATIGSKSGPSATLLFPHSSYAFP